MKTHFSCPNCETKYSALPEQVGKSGECKNCGTTITVPKSVIGDSTLSAGRQKNESKIHSRETPTIQGSYWFGYIYALFVGYLAVISFSNFLTVFLRGEGNPLTSPKIVLATEAWIYLIGSLCAAIWLAFICAKLFRQTISPLMVYSVAALHGLSVFIRGIIPTELFIWFLTSGYAIYYFRKRTISHTN